MPLFLQSNPSLHTADNVNHNYMNGPIRGSSILSSIPTSSKTSTNTKPKQSNKNINYNNIMDDSNDVENYASNNKANTKTKKSSKELNPFFHNNQKFANNNNNFIDPTNETSFDSLNTGSCGKNTTTTTRKQRDSNQQNESTSRKKKDSTTTSNKKLSKATENKRDHSSTTNDKAKSKKINLYQSNTYSMSTTSQSSDIGDNTYDEQPVRKIKFTAYSQMMTDSCDDDDEIHNPVGQLNKTTASTTQPQKPKSSLDNALDKALYGDGSSDDYPPATELLTKKPHTSTTKSTRSEKTIKNSKSASVDGNNNGGDKAKRKHNKKNKDVLDVTDTNKDQNDFDLLQQKFNKNTSQPRQPPVSQSLLSLQIGDLETIEKQSQKKKRKNPIVKEEVDLSNEPRPEKKKKSKGRDVDDEAIRELNDKQYGSPQVVTRPNIQLIDQLMDYSTTTKPTVSIEKESKPRKSKKDNMNNHSQRDELVVSQSKKPKKTTPSRDDGAHDIDSVSLPIATIHDEHVNDAMDLSNHNNIPTAATNKNESLFSPTPTKISLEAFDKKTIQSPGGTVTVHVFNSSKFKAQRQQQQQQQIEAEKQKKLKQTDRERAEKLALEKKNYTKSRREEQLSQQYQQTTFENENNHTNQQHIIDELAQTIHPTVLTHNFDLTPIKYTTSPNIPPDNKDAFNQKKRKFSTLPQNLTMTEDMSDVDDTDNNNNYKYNAVNIKKQRHNNHIKNIHTGINNVTPNKNEPNENEYVHIDDYNNKDVQKIEMDHNVSSKLNKLGKTPMTSAIALINESIESFQHGELPHSNFNHNTNSFKNNSTTISHEVQPATHFDINSMKASQSYPYVQEQMAAVLSLVKTVMMEKTKQYKKIYSAVKKNHTLGIERGLADDAIPVAPNVRDYVMNKLNSIAESEMKIAATIEQIKSGFDLVTVPPNTTKATTTTATTTTATTLSTNSKLPPKVSKTVSNKTHLYPDHDEYIASNQMSNENYSTKNSEPNRNQFSQRVYDKYAPVKKKERSSRQHNNSQSKHHQQQQQQQHLPPHHHPSNNTNYPQQYPSQVRIPSSLNNPIMDHIIIQSRPQQFGMRPTTKRY